MLRSMLQDNKVNNIKEGLEINLDNFGVTEMRWPKPAELQTGKYRTIDSGSVDNKPGQSWNILCIVKSAKIIVFSTCLNKPQLSTFCMVVIKT